MGVIANPGSPPQSAAGWPAASFRTRRSHLANPLQAGQKPAVLVIIDQLCAKGGAEQVMVRMVNGLPSLGYVPHVLTFAIDESLGFRDLLRCPLHVLPLSRTYDWNALTVARRIRRLVCTHNIAITHTFHETADLWGGMIAKLCGCPILISSRRDMGFQRESKHTLAYRWLRHFFDEVHTVSDEVRQFCIETDGLPPHRVRTIHNGIAVPDLASAASKWMLRERFGLPATAPLIVSVGHVRYIKGFDILVRVAREVIAAKPEAIFAVAGRDHEPDYALALRQSVAELDLTRNVRFLGPVDDVHSLLRASDVFCLPSRSEGLSNALLEAMACQLPCVASRVGGNPELIRQGETGYLFDSGDHQMAARHILNLLDDDRRSDALGRAARELVVSHFSTETMLGEIAAAYRRLLSSHGANIYPQLIQD